MKKIANLQDLFLLSARRNRTSVTVFLVNGFQMRGAISTIVPIAAIDLKGAEESEE